MLKDPKVKRNGLCARPGCKNKVEVKRNPKVQNRGLMIDPFCSTVCCKAYYGVTIQKGSM